ncbi:MAG TPA: 1-(5-phosphoribosyl)-5-[(5-phosphoribosylamino)methylideneamino]imidazole-4-carboxamide isomerase [Smithella sp.]|nr:MAG: 1-(5-phosphoribosyl)-5-((5-phosphoribosylamino)methylideneamino) imidazole-4-carboxamide isomerase [Deltaproteobacteria bacterium ADurb.Bin022]HNQ64914.1 1-(5-phosphoribosyl)-5-[(5-phosphoribosylamino)methylideneamino]imidazole-4-carboxamide isomerase [Smithella sp.]HOE33112.1 1-(5-phosphoribosyl)-5-[(5-phosphoribosylamino)methylideneamino]imidazole-4-carboxamide isomerase [Smithella sp.]HOG11004.1 1-(5-phosphoribosyl)-5-[(5-phosphoribosylamino)methylideneamino]imidazole-4-carboxamide is
MIIIPAIDIKDGKCVRLAQGKFDRVTTYADNPLDMALLWARKGAELIHIVDLDGSVAGRPRNADIILNIVENINVPVQIGGGIRDMETIRFYLDQGVSSVILGTTALKNQQIVREACTVFPGRIILGIDALNGKVAVRGWTENTEKNAVDLARQYEPYGVKAIVYTDIERDGMGTGINMKATRELADSVSIPVIASGGVASIADVDNLMVVEGGSIFGVIIGRALYTGAVDLEEAISKTKKVTRT